MVLKILEPIEIDSIDIFDFVFIRRNDFSLMDLLSPAPMPQPKSWMFQMPIWILGVLFNKIFSTLIRAEVHFFSYIINVMYRATKCAILLITRTLCFIGPHDSFLLNFLHNIWLLGCFSIILLFVAAAVAIFAGHLYFPWLYMEPTIAFYTPVVRDIIMTYWSSHTLHEMVSIFK